MKKIIISVAFSLFAAFVISCGGKNVNGNIVKGSTAEFDTLSYAIGLDMANGIKRNLGNLKLDFKLVEKAIETAALDKKSLKSGETEIDEKTVGDTLRPFFMQTYRERIQKVREMELAKNDTTGTATQIKPEDLDFNPETMFASDEEMQLISSAFGYDVGVNLQKNNFPVHLVWFIQAIEDVNGGSPKMTEQETGEYLRYYFTEKVPAENKKASEEWLADVEKQNGVQKTESGLLYKVVEAGDESVKPGAADTVKVHYKGTTRNGKVFDASRFADMPAERQEMLKMYRPDTYNEDTPIEFPLNAVIKGWTEGLQLMGKGGKMTLWIPSELAYGKRGAGQNIGPNEALCFEIELLDVKPVAAVPAE